jgi:Double-stranded DNA-binding domain
VARIAMVKPDKARGVEDIIINAAKRGQLGEQVRAALARVGLNRTELVSFGMHIGTFGPCMAAMHRIPFR